MTEATNTCDCGQCYEGWLSPRMRERLESSSHLQYGLSAYLLATQNSVVAQVGEGLPIDYTSIDSAVRYLPKDVRRKIGPSASSKSSSAGDEVYRGYVAVFKAITELVPLENEGANSDKGFPTASIISAHLSSLRDAGSPNPDAARIALFLDSGGKAEHALDYIVDCVREEHSPLGRRYTPDEQFIDHIVDSAANLPECANDLNFELVRVRLGLTRETLGVDPEDEADPVSDDGE